VRFPCVLCLRRIDAKNQKWQEKSCRRVAEHEHRRGRMPAGTGLKSPYADFLFSNAICLLMSRFIASRMTLLFAVLP